MPATAYIDVGEPEPISADGYIPRVLPAGWRKLESGYDGAVFEYSGIRGYMTVILSTARERDGRKWLHVSVAHPEKIPSWDTLKTVKTIFIGRNRVALQVLPSETEYVNHHPFCLHLFTCLDGNVTPDFTRGRGTL